VRENDPDTGGADRDTIVVTVHDSDLESAAGTPALLRSALDHLRLDGALFFRSEMTEPFAFESVPNALAHALHPGAERLIIFHIVAQGACWVSSEGGDLYWARAGDVIVMPYGDRHTIGGHQDADPVSIITLIEPPPWDELPVLQYGGGGIRSDLVCGYLVSDDPLFDPALRVFPPVFVVQMPDGASARWVRESVEYVMKDFVPAHDKQSTVATRLPELVLMEVLKAHLATAPAVESGWLAALRDPVLAPALAELHRAPEFHWTVAEIAAAAAVSRSVLDERFRQVLGRSPIKYLTEWRMHLADELLATTDVTVFAIARRVGYDSEESFSRAFKRARGLSPSHWRAERRARNAAAT
jgi:AraC-like DNA-binding protein